MRAFVQGLSLAGEVAGFSLCDVQTEIPILPIPEPTRSVSVMSPLKVDPLPGASAATSFLQLSNQIMNLGYGRLSGWLMGNLTQEQLVALQALCAATVNVQRREES